MTNYNLDGYDFLTSCFEEYQTKCYNEKQVEEDKKQVEESENEVKVDKPKCIFKRWAQLNLDTIPILIKLSIKCPSAIAIFLFILDQMNNYNALVCSQKVMSEAIGISMASVANGINALKERNIIYVYKSGTVNVYTLNPITSWKSWSTNLKYCEFPNSKIIISQSENNIKYNNIKYNKKPIIVNKNNPSDRT